MGTIKTEMLRAGGLVWLDGDNGLRGDPLGPVMHLHDGAAEVFFFLDGRCRIEIGDTVSVVEAGHFVYVPPEVPHNLVKEGSGDLRLFFAVAPNFVDNKWRTTGFARDGWEGTTKVLRVSGPGALPGDGHLRSRAVRLQERVDGAVGEEERVYLVLQGAVRYVDSVLSGDLEQGDFVHVLAGRPHSLESDSALVLEVTAASR